MSNQANQPAFPQLDELDGKEYMDGVPGGYRASSSGGLTKREYFAAMAMQGFLAADLKMQKSILEVKLKDGVETVEVATAKIAVSVADALLAELEKGAQ